MIQDLADYVEKNGYEQVADPEAIRILLQRTIEWAKDEAPLDFDESFIHHLYSWFHEGRGLSNKQVKAIVNIVRGFEIN